MKKNLVVTAILLLVTEAALADGKEPIDLFQYGVIDHFIELRRDGYSSSCIEASKVAAQFMAQYRENWRPEDLTNFLLNNKEVINSAGFGIRDFVDNFGGPEIHLDKKQSVISFSTKFSSQCAPSGGVTSNSTGNYGAVVPRYDVNAYCQDVKDYSGGSNQIYNSCIDAQQQAYDFLKLTYRMIPAETAKYCNEVAEFSGGSYQVLMTCIDQEIAASGGKKKFKF